MYPSYQRDTALLQPNFPHRFEESSRGSSYRIMDSGHNPLPYPDTSTPSPSSLIASTDRPNVSSSPSSSSLLLDSSDVVRSASNHSRPPTCASVRGVSPMVRTIPMSMSGHALQLSPAAGARSVVTVPSRSATTVLGVKGIKSALTILNQSVEGLIGLRERVLLAQGRRPMEDLPHGAGVVVP